MLTVSVFALCTQRVRTAQCAIGYAASGVVLLPAAIGNLFVSYYPHKRLALNRSIRDWAFWERFSYAHSTERVRLATNQLLRWFVRSQYFLSVGSFSVIATRCVDCSSALVDCHVQFAFFCSDNRFACTPLQSVGSGNEMLCTREMRCQKAVGT